MQARLEKLVRRCLQAGRKSSLAGFDFVFPRRCPWCGEHPQLDEQPQSLDAALCTTCRLGVAPLVESACRRCGAPVGPHLGSSQRCIYCLDDRFAFHGVVCLGTYAGLLRAACLKMKEPGGDPLCVALAALLWERSGASLSAACIDAVIPVPRYWQQRLWRPHNPAVALAQTLSSRLHAKFFAHILRKVRNTPAQADLPPYKRRTNLRGAFRVFRPHAVAGRIVLLVDDILTTGTTANEASKTLLRAGAKSVVVATIARGLGSSSRA